MGVRFHLTHQKHIGEDGVYTEGLHGNALLIVFDQQGAVSDGGGGDVDGPLHHEGALSVDVEHLTSDPAKTRGNLNVHGELQAEGDNQ